MSRRQEQERRRKRQARRQRSARREKREERGPQSRGSIDLRVPRPELAHPPVYVDQSGVRTVDPFERLGLDPRAPVTRESVQAAFRAALAETPPEQDAARAQELLEARDFLLDPEQLLTRTLGDLRVPKAERFIPDHVSQQRPSAAREVPTATDWSARSRLIAILTLYALLEEELERGDGPRRRPDSLFE